MLDLVCKRYPGRRPSDYLELDDYTGLQLDYALALKYSLEDGKNEAIKLEAIQEMLKPIGSALGVKYQKQKPKLEERKIPDGLDVDEVLAMIGGNKPGMKVSHNGN